MKWVIQTNLYNEHGYVRFVKALDRLNLDYMTVKPVPFTNILLPSDFDSSSQDISDGNGIQFDTSEKIIAFGSITLCRIAIHQGWNPGSYVNENFTFQKWKDGFGQENLLSSDAVVAPLHEFENFDFGVLNTDYVFSRPVEDTKAFSGMCLKVSQFKNWIKEFVDLESDGLLTPLHKDTEILVASSRKIQAEYRIFVVNEKVVTASRYKLGNQVLHHEVVDNDVIEFVEKMINKWQPSKAFVIDVARVDNGFKIIEINNINSAGFYQADVQKIILAIEAMEK